jgi:alkaline phosphatase D
MKSLLARRIFLRGLLVTIAAGGAAACGDDTSDGGGGGGPADIFSTDPADQDRVYPQGVASGDPRPDSVILWTRVEPEGEAGPHDVTVDVSTTEDFAEIVATATVPAEEAYDHTIRVKVTGLAPYTTHYYRFRARGVEAPIGRTKTAPAADQDVSVRFAFASCQDFIGRYYHAWQVLCDEATPVDFVLFLGDYIYETNGDPLFQESGSDRTIVIEEGIQLLEEEPSVKAAATIGDYRGIYKQMRRDANLRRAHALFPFICIWDDHEFANDCWQDHATDFNDAQGDEKSPERRHAASRAWFEYQPADVQFDDAAAPPDDLRIYRTLRFGKHVELFLTDQRSYRDDHVIPEGAPGDGRPEGAPDTVPTYSEVGHIDGFKNSEVFSRNFVKKPAFDLIEAYVAPTILGGEQKSWLVGGITGSTATWKVWGNEVQLAQMMLDLREFAIPESFKDIYYFTADQWDGYRTERKEILTALAGTPNIVALTGDIHAFYACEIHVDPDDLSGNPMLVEYVTAGISSSPAQEITQGVVDSNPAFGTLADLVPQFDPILQATSLEYRYANSRAHGVSIAEIDGAEVRVTFLEILDVKSPTFDGAVTRRTFRTPAGSARVEQV